MLEMRQNFKCFDYDLLVCSFSDCFSMSTVKVLESRFSLFIFLEEFFSCFTEQHRYSWHLVDTHGIRQIEPFLLPELRSMAFTIFSLESVLPLKIKNTIREQKFYLILREPLLASKYKFARNFTF